MKRVTPRRPPSPRPPRKAPAPLPKVIHARSGPLHAEIVVVGRELLRGRLGDTHGPWLAGELSRRGALVHRITVVDDLERSIATAIGESIGRGVHLVVTTGGLGPAADDRTLAGVAEAIHLPLTLNPPARDMVEAAYRRMKSEGSASTEAMNRVREKLCMLCVGAEAIENPKGIAPGMLVRLTGGGAVLCLPGTPEELRAVFDAAIAGIKDLFPTGASATRELETPTRDESSLRPILDRVRHEHPFVWIQTRPGRRRGAPVIISLEAFAATAREAESQVDGALRRLLALAGGGR